MGVDPKAAEFAEEKWGGERDYDALLKKAEEDHTLMQSRIDNQKAIIDRLTLRVRELEMDLATERASGHP